MPPFIPRDCGPSSAYIALTVSDGLAQTSSPVLSISSAWPALGAIAKDAGESSQVRAGRDEHLGHPSPSRADFAEILGS